LVSVSTDETKNRGHEDNEPAGPPPGVFALLVAILGVVLTAGLVAASAL
jgi:hypothetical protein